MANEIRHLKVLANDGLRLAVEDAGPRHGGAGAPLLCLAGLTRTKRDFYPLRDHFAFHPTHPRRVVLMDLRGRGASAFAEDPATYTMQREADDAANVACALGLHGIVIVGTSRGGVLAMVLALTKPALLAGSVLNDIGPRIAGAGLARLKVQLPASTVPQTWEEATSLVRAAMEPQFPSFDEDDWAAYARDTFAEDNGRPARAYDERLLAPLADLPDGLPFIDLSGPFKALACRPTLLLHGANSDLLDRPIVDDAKAMGATVHIVPGEGHAPRLRGNVLERIGSFLQDHAL